MIITVWCPAKRFCRPCARAQIAVLQSQHCTSGIGHIFSRVTQGMQHSSGTQGQNPAEDIAAGQLCENSLEAVTDLISRDLDGSLEPGALAYVEFDVHVSQLILLPMLCIGTTMPCQRYIE